MHVNFTSLAILAGKETMSFKEAYKRIFNETNLSRFVVFDGMLTKDVCMHFKQNE